MGLYIVNIKRNANQCVDSQMRYLDNNVELKKVLLAILAEEYIPHEHFLDENNW